MKSKKIISGLLALTFVFGGTALPNTVVNNSVVASAATKNVEVITYGDYDYIQLEDGTVEIAKYNGTDEVVEIPGEIDGAVVTSIGEKAFDENKTITSVTIPEGVKTIGAHAFSSCKNLREVTIPDSVETLGYGALSYCEALESVTLSNKLTKIEENEFVNCKKLTSIKLPSGIKSIGEKAFLSCTNLEKINLPDGLETINSEAFKNCNKLAKIEMPDSVTYIGGSAFCFDGTKDCALTKVTLSSNLKSMYNYNFYNCKKVKEITVPESVTSLGRGSFANNGSGFTLKILNSTYAEQHAKHALEYGINFKIIDVDEKTEYPIPSSAEFNSEFHQFRLNWTAVEGAEKYAIAVYLANKWRPQVYTDAKTTSFTSPKLKSATYKMVICARINGEWDTSNLDKRSSRLWVR